MKSFDVMRSQWMKGMTYQTLRGDQSPSHFEIHFNIILPFAHRSSKWSVSVRSPHQNQACASAVPLTWHMPHPSGAYQEAVNLFPLEMKEIVGTNMNSDYIQCSGLIYYQFKHWDVMISTAWQRDGGGEVRWGEVRCCVDLNKRWV
jgi:hypothetical protein